MGNLVENFKSSQDSQKHLGHYSNPAQWEDMAEEIDTYAREENMSFAQARDILMSKKFD